MDNIETQIEIKTKIIESYFKEYKQLNDLINTSLNIRYKDIKILKYICMPKRFYRSYFLEIKQLNFYQIKPITAKQKSELKEMIFDLNKYTIK